METKLAIVGSRSFTDYLTFEGVIDEICRKYRYNCSEIISGGAKGTDTLAETYALKHKIPTKIFKPNWGLYGKSAGIIRNWEIINSCDVCVIFWNYISPGTKNDVALCEKLGKTFYIYNFLNNELKNNYQIKSK